jgi:hypothetical protein
MIKLQRRLEVTMEELFTTKELNAARKIFSKYKAKPRYFREQKMSDEVVKPKLSQINDCTAIATSRNAGLMP